MSQKSGLDIFFKGCRDGLPFMLVVVPFGLLFGVVAIDAGLSFVEAMAMTSLVIAGASQFTAVHLLSDGTGVAVVVVTALAVNLRMAMYSASLVPYLGSAPLWQRALVAYLNFDQTYAVSVATYEERDDWTVSEKVIYFFGVATPIAPMWIIMSAIGAAAGQSIPYELGLDFILPITFISLFAPMLKSLPHVVAALVSTFVALGLVWVPNGLGLLIAAACAMVAGAVCEAQLEKRGMAK